MQTCFELHHQGNLFAEGQYNVIKRETFKKLKFLLHPTNKLNAIISHLQTYFSMHYYLIRPFESRESSMQSIFDVQIIFIA